MPQLRNPRHERFVAFLAQGKSAAAAYKLAGFAPDTGNAVRLTGNDSVKARLAEVQGKNARKTEITVGSLVGELDAACRQAQELGQPNVIVSASALKAKIAGLDIKRMEVGGVGEFAFEGCDAAPDFVEKMIEAGDDLHALLEALDQLRGAIIDRLSDRAEVIQPD